ncbi:hypothetical protein PG996_004617 [Apiospora saccharicola]|uniref:Transcriptional regulatory protein RXT2 N-terminal domain-containing protein n=1 Tax=Apiospora saccharicola TaxID=335842 RepID=A0ABR1W4S9_9PEZI
MSNPDRLKHPLGDEDTNTAPPPKRVKRNESDHYYSTSHSSASKVDQQMPDDNKNSVNKKEPENVFSDILADEIVDKDTLDVLMGEAPYAHHLITEDDTPGQQQLELGDAPNIGTPEDNNLLLNKQFMEADLQLFRSQLAEAETKLQEIPSPQQQQQQPQDPAAAAQIHQRQLLLNERLVLMAMIKSSEDWLRYIEHGDPLDNTA